MKIPWDQLSEKALHALVEEYVSREGTEYGSWEVPLARKVQQVKAQLREGTAVISFDIESGSTSIMPADPSAN